MYQFPDKLDVIPWAEIPEKQRGFFCFDDDYLPLPTSHSQQISLLKKFSAKELSIWLDHALPSGWSGDDLAFPQYESIRLEDSHWNTEEGRQAIRKWLHDRNVPYSQSVYLFYDRDQVVMLPWKLLIKYWDAFSSSVGYAMIAADHTAEWGCLFHHEEVIEFGSYLKREVVNC